MPAPAVALDRLSAAALAGTLALVWLAVAPPTPDLAAALYRAGLYAREGFTLYDSAWYGGHHMPGYSIVSPALGALVGVRTAGAVGAVVAAALFQRLATHHWGRAARPAVLLYALGTVTGLLIGRVAFGLGVAVGLGALLALQRGRGGWAVALAVGCAATSPVAAVFLAMAAGAVWLEDRRRRDALGVATGALGTTVTLALLFPEGGAQPCDPTVLLAVLGASAIVWALSVGREPVLRRGAELYALMGLLSFLLPTPMGSNVTRLGAEFGLPVAAALLAGGGPRAPVPRALRGRAVLLLALGWLVVFQWLAPVVETSKAAGDPSLHAAYYAPLIAALRERTDGPVRVEVPFTRGHFEATHLAPAFPLARGWQTQLDVKHNGVLRRPGLTPARYGAWLRRNGVAFVALPDVPLDRSSRQEARVIRARPAFLRPVWRGAHWRLLEVNDPAPLVTGPARLTHLGTERLTLRATAAGSVLVRVRWTPYWSASGGACAEPTASGWTRVHLPGPGTYGVRAAFSLARALRADGRC